MNKKKMSVANFNVVFVESDEEEKPLLEYFDDIFMPALKSEVVKKVSEDTSYSIIDLKVIDVGIQGYAVVGIIVKSTVLEVFSGLDENGELKPLNDKYPSAPYSTFVIYLKNHRMVFVKNQKGSPTLANFTSLIRKKIFAYTKAENQKLSAKGMKELPFADINVVGLPLVGKIKQALKDVEKINTLTLRFYPLNGELELQNMFGEMAGELRRKVGSRNGELILKSPSNIQGVIDVIESAEGTVEPIIKVIYPDKTNGIIKNDKISENMEIEIERSEIENEIVFIADSASKIESIKRISPSNEEIYQNNKEKILPFLSK